MDPRCVNGHPVRPDAGFCTTCGSRVAAPSAPVRTCPSGHPVAADAAFCSTCGARLDAPPALPATMGFAVPPVAPAPLPSAPMPPAPASWPPGLGAYATVAAPAYAGPVPGSSATTSAAATSSYAYAPAGPMSTLAIAAFVTSLVWVWGVTSLVAILLAVRALRQLKTSGERGRPLAIAAIVIGAIGIVIALGVLLAHR